MVIYVDPAISTLVAEIRGLEAGLQTRRIERERKCIALRESKENDFTYFNVWKRLFFQLRGVGVSELEFVKASASVDRRIKKGGYLGLMFIERPKHTLLMTNTILKDLENDAASGDALIFLSNCNDTNNKIPEVAGQIKQFSEKESNYSRSIVAKCKLKKEYQFSLTSGNDAVLLTKLQILLDGCQGDSLCENDTLYIKDRIYAAKCKFLTLKLIQLYLVLHRTGKLVVTERLFEHLKNAVVSPSTKAMKQVDIAISLESCRLLFESGNFCEKAEGFIFRLINSDNPNSRFLAFNFAVKYGVFAELVVERIIRLGAHDLFHLEILKALINRSNYRRVYHQREEIMHYVLKGDIDFDKAEHVSQNLLVRIAELSDFEFLCKVLCENPGIYKKIRNRNLLVMDQTRPLFRSIVLKDEIEYFLLIYDIMPSKTNDSGMVASLALRHLGALTSGHIDDNKLELLDSLFDVLCIYGDIGENRKLVLEAFQKALCRHAEHGLTEALLSGLLLFNLVLSPKYIYAGAGLFVEYHMGNEQITIRHADRVESVEVSCTRSTIPQLDSQEGDGLITRKFSTKDCHALSISVKNGDESATKYILIN